MVADATPRDRSALRRVTAPLARVAPARLQRSTAPPASASGTRWCGKRRRGSRAAAVAVGLLTLALLGIVLASGLALMDKDLAWLEFDRCGDAAFSCGIIAGLLVTIVPLALAYVLLVFWRVERVRREYVRHARAHPADLVEAAGSTADIVGRDDLCDVMQRDLQERDSRRPHVLVGGVGVGKTAVLVQLTKLLADREAVPVPIRLRESQGGLDFHELARARFTKLAERWVSAGDADKVWRKLRDNDLIVVIADGLEEAMQDNEARDSAIRVAIDEAADQGLPLVVASRPHDAVTYLEAAVLRLEPLSERVACDYILAGGGPGESRADRERIRRIVERAEVVEAPLYMQVARELHDVDALRRVDTRHASRIALRAALLAAWTDQLIAGRIASDKPLVKDDRARAVRTLGAVACIGLQSDSLEVRFADCERFAHAAGLEDLAASEIKFAASAGSRLGLVEALPQAVRFRHSIMQAYLGARWPGDVLHDRDFVAEGLRDPGREFLMALAMHFAKADTPKDGAGLRNDLLEAAKRRSDSKAIDLLAAAVEIDNALTGATAVHTVKAVRDGWQRVPVRDEVSRQAKLRAVARLGEAGMSHSNGPVLPRRARVIRHRSEDVYGTLWHICTTEDAYAVRLAAAQELGAGGAPAFARVVGDFRETLKDAEAVYRAQRPAPDAVTERRFALQGWILPLLVGSIEEHEIAHEASELLDAWVELVGPRMHFSVEASLAQGFKYESNRRPDRVPRGEARAFLMEHANTMLERAQFWFSRISLLQALSLWALQEQPEPKLTARQRVERWLGSDTHVFVREAADLCIRALESGEPSRFLWIDETGVASKVGPSAAHPEWERTRRLWISPAVGWLALDPRAQQLVGDIIILLNLAEREMRRDQEARMQRETRLRRLGKDLPPCLTEPGGRAFLQVERTGERGAGAGTECMPGCPVRLCPLPPKGQPLFRGELSETFCRSQHTHLTGRRGQRAPWQRAHQTELRTFWSEMERRARA